MNTLPVSTATAQGKTNGNHSAPTHTLNYQTGQTILTVPVNLSQLSLYQHYSLQGCSFYATCKPQSNFPAILPYKSYLSLTHDRIDPKNVDFLLNHEACVFSVLPPPLCSHTKTHIKKQSLTVTFQTCAFALCIMFDFMCMLTYMCTVGVYSVRQR